MWEKCLKCTVGGLILYLTSHASKAGVEHCMQGSLWALLPNKRTACGLSHFLKLFAWRHASQTAFCRSTLWSVSLAYQATQGKGRLCHCFLHCDLFWPLPRALHSEHTRWCYLWFLTCCFTAVTFPRSIFTNGQTCVNRTHTSGTHQCQLL